MDQRPECKSENYETVRKKKTGIYFHDLRLGNHFLDMIPTAQVTKKSQS